MARRVSGKTQSLEISDFNGIPVMMEPEGIAFIKSQDEFHRVIGGDFYRTSVQSSSVAADELYISPSGRLVVEGKSRILTDGAMLQLLNLLRIPLTYAKRIPAELLVLTVNHILKGIPNRKFQIRTGPNDCALGIWRDKGDFIRTIYDVFTFMLEEVKDISFHFVVLEKSIGGLMLEFNDMKDDVSAGVEVLHSDNGSVKTVITGYIFSPDGHAMIKATSKRPNSEAGWEVFKNSVAAVILEIKAEMPKYLEAFKRMGEHKITEEIAGGISKSALTALKKQIGVETGSTLMDVYSNLMTIRKEKGKTLKSKRDIAAFAGGVASLAYI